MNMDVKIQRLRPRVFSRSSASWRFIARLVRLPNWPEIPAKPDAHGAFIRLALAFRGEKLSVAVLPRRVAAFPQTKGGANG